MNTYLYQHCFHKLTLRRLIGWLHFKKQQVIIYLWIVVYHCCVLNSTRRLAQSLKYCSEVCFTFSVVDKCSTNPCKNGGACSIKYHKVVCDCGATGTFKSAYCYHNVTEVVNIVTVSS